MEKKTNLIYCIDKKLDIDNGKEMSSIKSSKNKEDVEDEKVSQNSRMVLYMTPNQLLQILKQRAILLPNKQSMNSTSSTKIN
jgi:hypothetical protein